MWEIHTSQNQLGPAGGGGGGHAGFCMEALVNFLNHSITIKSILAGRLVYHPDKPHLAVCSTVLSCI